MMFRLRSLVVGVVATAVCGLAAPVVTPAAAARVAPPVVTRARGETRGTIVLVHGGGWQATGVTAVRTMLPTARRFARWGYRAVSVDYAPGQDGLKDVLAAIDDARARSAGLPVCVYGFSAGGHWALIAAARRRWLRCVIAVAAPTDLVAAVLFTPTSDLGRLAESLFGDVLAAYSPLFLAPKVRARVLLTYGARDPVVPLPQGLVMQKALGDLGRLVVMPPGSITWGHSTSTAAAIAELAVDERAWLRDAAP